MKKRMLVLLLAAAICISGCGRHPEGADSARDRGESGVQQDSGTARDGEEGSFPETPGET